MKVIAFFEVRTSDKSHVKIRKLITSERASFCCKRDTHTNLPMLEMLERIFIQRKSGLTEVQFFVKLDRNILL